MRRRLLLLAAVVVPSAAMLAAAAHGCGNEQPFESGCLWMADPNNCYRDFREDMKSVAGATLDNQSGDCKPLGDPTEANQPGNSLGTPNGTFLKRDTLDVCILSQGGQVVLDPPIDLTMWPPSLTADPVTYKISFLAPDGNPCGQATYTSPHGFSLTIIAPPDAGTSSGTGGSTTTTTSSTGDAGRTPIPYGTFAEVISPGRDAYDVTCPSGESHHFNLNEISGADGGTCPAFVNFFPSASFQVYPGGVDHVGAISFAITFPPIPSADGGTDTYPQDAAAPPTSGDRVVYFNCTIPGALEQCADMVKNGGETDVDCGGPTFPSGDGGTCPSRCADGLQCLQDTDCEAGHTCVPDPMTGMRKCGCIAKTTCGTGQNCGSISDGCGGTVDCGTCPDPAHPCGGGGTANVCGCCGVACTVCAAPETCGGGGTAGTCGCTPLTACPAGLNCGQISNGCGSTVDCGTCTAPQTCMGGGKANVCGCTPMTMCPTGLDCGNVMDGCGGMINCGTCSAPKTCGGGGNANVCG